MLVGYRRLETLFRRSAGLDLTKERAKEACEFVQKKLHDLLLVGERNASYNAREVIWESDLPITIGLANSIQAYKQLELEEEVELGPIKEYLATVPPLKYPLEVELENRLPDIVGGLMVCLAQVIRRLTDERGFHAEDLARACEILDLTL